MRQLLTNLDQLVRRVRALGHPAVAALDADTMHQHQNPAIRCRNAAAPIAHFNFLVAGMQGPGCLVAFASRKTVGVLAQQGLGDIRQIAHVSRLQLVKRFGAPEFQASRIGPDNTIMVEIKHPDRVFDQRPCRCIDSKCCNRGMFHAFGNEFTPEKSYVCCEQALTLHQQRKQLQNILPRRRSGELLSAIIPRRKPTGTCANRPDNHHGLQTAHCSRSSRRRSGPAIRSAGPFPHSPFRPANAAVPGR